MMLYIAKKDKSVNACAFYNVNTKECRVQKESLISEDISKGTFRSAKSVSDRRANEKIKNRVLLNDVSFKSASSAANFVMGSSTNGLIAWKDEKGRTLKKLLAGGE